MNSFTDTEKRRIVSVLLGYDLSLIELMNQLIDEEKRLVAQVPPHMRIVSLPINIPGAQAIELASGLRLVVQYHIESDKFSARLHMGLDEKARP